MWHHCFIINCMLSDWRVEASTGSPKGEYMNEQKESKYVYSMITTSAIDKLEKSVLVANFKIDP